jgi:hypothetical protein
MNKNLIAAALIPLVLTLTACGGGGGSDNGGINPTPTNKAPIANARDACIYIC